MISTLFASQWCPVEIPPKTSQAIHNCYPRLELIQSEIQQNYHYGMDLEALLARPSFSIERQPEFIRIHNLFLPRSPHTYPIKGTCSELAFVACKRLTQILGRHYHFYMARGLADTLFSAEGATHFYLLAWPRTSNLHTQMKQILGKEFSPAIPLPKGCLLIDPSFQRVSVVDETCQYKVSKLVHSEVDPQDSIWLSPQSIPPLKLKFLTQHITAPIPIGYVDDLFPWGFANPAQTLPSDGLLYFCFSNDQFVRPNEALIVYKNPGNTGYKPVMHLLPPGSLIERFYQRLKA